MEKQLHRQTVGNSRIALILPAVARLLLAIGMIFSAGTASHGAPATNVMIIRVPDGGIQPQVVTGNDGVLHLLYFKGEATHGDLFYVRSGDEGVTFSAPIRVNSQEGSAVAAGTIRGGQIALGRNGRVHVAWNGSMTAQPAGPLNVESGRPGHPMLYTQLNEAGSAFEPQRNLMTRTFGLDGGGTITADERGNVYVAWHGKEQDSLKGEAGRKVFLAKSTNDGKSFSPERPVWDKPTGACGCCGMRILADQTGQVHVLYRSATDEVNRDIYLLSGAPGANSFKGNLLHPWRINACPMSSMSFTQADNSVFVTWETAGQVYYSAVKAQEISRPVAAAEEPGKRKHPVLATKKGGDVLFAWIEGSGWQKGGSLAWRMFDTAGKPQSEIQVVGPAPTWSFAAAVARKDGGFTIIY
jgi:hypothetical protein